MENTDTIENNDIDFYTEHKARGEQLRDLLRPLLELNPRERFVFVEYHYFNTHMRDVSAGLKVGLGRAYEILTRAEDKINIAINDSASPQETESGSPSPKADTLKNLRAIQSLVRSQKKRDGLTTAT